MHMSASQLDAAGETHCCPKFQAMLQQFASGLYPIVKTLADMVANAQAVYTSLREAEYRSTAFIPYWNIAVLRAIVPRQRRCTEALKIINATLDGLIQRCKDLVEEEDQEFVEEFVGRQDPSILHFLLASGDQVPADIIPTPLTAVKHCTSVA